MWRVIRGDGLVGHTLNHHNDPLPDGEVAADLGIIGQEIEEGIGSEAEFYRAHASWIKGGVGPYPIA